MRKLELLAPAGDLEKLKVAIDYGADAVYFAGEMFGLRASAGNLSIPEIREGMEYAHAHGARGYMAVNIIAHNEDIDRLGGFLSEIKDIPIDAFIISDPGIIYMLREQMPYAEIHLSTQANTTNYLSARFWSENGVKRIIAAREMSLSELKEFREKIPDDMELEAFVHGAMCISYSGRCLLSNFMINRDANRGECAHPCRWKYSLMEEKRPGEYFPIEEDERGTYIMNSKDLCMIEHIPELFESGISSAKIEGRMKSVFYVASVVRAYRAAIDAYQADPSNYTFFNDWKDELCKVSHRHFTTGFYFNKPSHEDQNYETSSYIKDYVFLGIVRSYDPTTKFAEIEQRNRILTGDTIEIFGPGEGFFEQVVEEMYDNNGMRIESAPHAQQIIRIKMLQPVGKTYILRKKKM